jgi:hypothetical protein
VLSDIEVSVQKQDPEVLSRLTRVKVHQKTVVTPVRSLCLTSDPNSEARALKENRSIRAINELPREVNIEKLNDIDNDSEKQEEFYRGIRYRFSGVDTSNDITVFMFSYSNRGSADKPNKEPTSTEVEYLCGVLNHPLNDLWVPPIIPELSGASYLPYLKRFYEEAKSYQHIACAGLVPHVSRLEIRQLADFYKKEGISYFLMDFAGKHPLDLVGNINQVVKMVHEIEKLRGNYCFLHAVNVPLTKAHWKTPVVPAKDILLFEMGFGAFGSSHIRRSYPEEVLKMMASQKIKRRFRLFNRKDYGYYTNESPGLDKMLTEEWPTVVSLKNFKGDHDWATINSLEKCFNVERHGLEANEIRRKLIEEESVAKHISAKTCIPPTYVKKVLRVGK